MDYGKLAYFELQELKRQLGLDNNKLPEEAVLAEEVVGQFLVRCDEPEETDDEAKIKVRTLQERITQLEAEHLD